MSYKRGIVDTQLKLAAAATLTASSNLAGLDLGSGFAPVGGKPVQAAIDVTAITTGGDQTYTFRIEDSPDGTTWTKRSADVGSIATGATIVQGVIHANQVRLVHTASGTSSKSITFKDVYLDPLIPD